MIDPPDEKPETPMLYAPPAPRISITHLVIAWVLILGGAYFAVNGLLQSNPSARVNILLMAFWLSVIGLYLRFRRPR